MRPPIYGSYYRPERTTLLAVGDFDVDAMKARIKVTFSDWRCDMRSPAAYRFALQGLEVTFADQLYPDADRPEFVGGFPCLLVGMAVSMRNF